MRSAKRCPPTPCVMCGRVRCPDAWEGKPPHQNIQVDPYVLLDQSLPGCHVWFKLFNINHSCGNQCGWSHTPSDRAGLGLGFHPHDGHRLSWVKVSLQCKMQRKSKLAAASGHILCSCSMTMLGPVALSQQIPSSQ